MRACASCQRRSAFYEQRRTGRRRVSSRPTVASFWSAFPFASEVRVSGVRVSGVRPPLTTGSAASPAGTPRSPCRQTSTPSSASASPRSSFVTANASAWRSVPAHPPARRRSCGPSAGASSRPRRRGAGIFRRSSGATVGTVQDRTPPKRELSVYIRPATALYGACAASPRRPKTPAEAGVLYDEPCRDRTCDHRIKRAEVQRISAVRQVCEHKEPAQRLIGQSKTRRTRRDHGLGWRAVGVRLTSARGARVGTTAPDTSASSRNKEANFEQPPGPSRCPNLTRPVYLVKELMSMISTVSEK